MSIYIKYVMASTYIQLYYAIVQIVPVINGGWGSWELSGVCSATCGGGQQRYERRCDNPAPQNGGLPCNGSDFKMELCNTQCCPGEPQVCSIHVH